MRRESKISIGIVIILILIIPPFLFTGISDVISIIDQSTDITPDEIKGMGDIYKLEGIKDATYLIVILGMLDVLSRIFTGKSFIDTLYRIRDTFFMITMLEIIGIVGFGIWYVVYKRYIV